ncbi:hypothetical protein RIF25_08105 [Thermosynechococcaceae cyanobacterium BACA0444]|uniref:Uncharacterized protein n=2 Tax=Cyanophyceae TaxID=3028117 RepID=A0AAE4FRF7_9CYAN|nr:hypothetical protein [Pseudocalidococcus azoricus]AFY61510.1 hypothetical protein Syn6312_2406 [Synechococcus sp. PCC 6312]MDS3860776.1 hypothetical protein [Pseudocalidococcus azoricus BACA0444]
MHYPIPGNLAEMTELDRQPVNAELVAAAIAGVVKMARDQGQTLEMLQLEVLAEDYLLDATTRRWLSELVGQAWETCL